MFKKIIKKIYQASKAFLHGLFWYARDLVKFKALSKRTGQKFTFRFFPMLFDKNPSSHTFDKHYVYMDRWAFKKILEKKPTEHVDVGSSIRFLSMASTVAKLKFVDIRPIKLDFENFECMEGNISNLPFADNSVESLSCLHVAEHIGLGRYGDPLDPLGTIKACRELMRVLKPGGSLYFALPIGKSAVYFNAHRVHDPLEIIRYFKNLRLISFSAVGDNGRFIDQAKPEDYARASYACGMYEFSK